MEELATQKKMVLFALVPWDLRVQLVRVSIHITLVLYLTLRQINHAHCFGWENLLNTAFFLRGDFFQVHRNQHTGNAKLSFYICLLAINNSLLKRIVSSMDIPGNSFGDNKAFTTL